MSPNDPEKLVKPLPLKPKLKKPLGTNANRYAYLKPTERAWLAGLIDGCGRIINHNIVNTTASSRLISYRILIRGTKIASQGVREAAELLRLKLRDYSPENGGYNNGRLEVSIPNTDIDDLMIVLKPYISAGKYNEYVRCKYLSELSQFKLGQAHKQYTEAGTRRFFKGIDWLQVDKLLEQPDITPALRKAIAKSTQYLNDKVT